MNLDQIICAAASAAGAASCRIYESSVSTENGCTAFLADVGERDVLVARDGFGFSGKKLEADGEAWVVCELTHDNAALLRKYFAFTAPVPVLRQKRTVGVGDRLGIAAPGHIRVFEKYDAYPVLAQQSIRELTLTNRSFEEVLDCASWGVFRAGFRRGFGADGDHLKTAEEVAYAIGCGYTMITLDCSEHIRNDVGALSDEAVLAQYKPDSMLEARYLNQRFHVNGTEIFFDKMDFYRMSLIYNEAIDFAVSIYQQFFTGKEHALDFEISIDETATPTTPAQHFYVASELIRRGVRPATIAPRFIGEFQKGIDYIGDLEQFEQEFRVHAAIADFFGYKLSIHSGSDKFSVFKIIGKYTHGRFHLKTAGTNWLEAMKVIAEHEPALYREIHQYALDEAFAKASAYYHVTTNLANIPALSTLTDAQLPELFANNDARQLIHITYGLILNEKNPDGTDRFRGRLYRAWRVYAEEYAGNLEKHIGKHLELLYSGFEE